MPTAVHGHWGPTSSWSHVGLHKFNSSGSLRYRRARNARNRGPGPAGRTEAHLTVENEGPRGRQDNRVEVQLGELWNLIRDDPNQFDEAYERPPVDRVGTSVPAEQWGGAECLEHRLDYIGSEWWNGKRAVVEEIGCNTAEPHHDEGTEVRIGDDADDRFDPAGHHGLDDSATHRSPRRAVMRS